jgi:DNA-binding GntR family transcriptional regulator
MLVQERLLEAIPHQGVRVRKHSVQEIEDFFELRAELEGLAASLAAERGSEAQFKELKEIVNNVEIGLAEKSIDKADAIAYNNRFHDVIAYASGNKALMDSLLQLRAGVNLLRTMAWLNDEQRTSVVNQQHKLICEAITNRNRQLARDQAKAHVWDALPWVLRSTQEFEKNEPDALK